MKSLQWTLANVDQPLMAARIVERVKLVGLAR